MRGNGDYPPFPDVSTKHTQTSTWHWNMHWRSIVNDRFAPHGKRILVEALSPGIKPHYLFSSQYQALAIVEEVARDNVFIQLDTFHAQKVDGNLTHLIRDYAGKYAHVQIAGLPDRHEPDDGEINYPWLFRLFDEVGYQGWIGCEYKPRGLTEEGLGWFDAWR